MARERRRGSSGLAAGEAAVTFIMAGFPIGLLVYYTWSNMLTTLQQYVMMRRFKVDNPIDRIIGRLTGKAPAAG